MCDETGIVMQKRQRVPRLPERVSAGSAGNPGSKAVDFIGKRRGSR
jgi:hypothetical protein